MKGIITVFVCLGMCCFVSETSYSGTHQLRNEEKQPIHANTGKGLKDPIDSAIQVVSSEINTLVSQSFISKGDSLRLKELSGRLAFLSGLTLRVTEAETDGDSHQSILQDKLSIAILIFGTLAFLIIMYFQTKGNKGVNYMTFKLFGVIFIGTVSVFLIPAGFDNAQITPIVGLLGTLAGYLIGTSRTNNQDNNSEVETPKSSSPEVEQKK